MELNLRGRTALVTGASKGIGRASAEALTDPPLPPSRTMQMSPGIRRIRMNTSAAAPTRVGIDSNRRFRM